MTSVLRIRTAGAVLTAGLCILQTGWYPAAQAGSPRQAQAPVVVEKVRKVRIRPEATLIGTVFPFRRSAVAGEAEGLVVEFPVRRGQRVEKGQVLARIQEQPYRLRLKAARAGLAEARENEAEARSELRRISALFEKKSVSSRTYDETAYRVKALRARIMALEAKIETIAYDMSRCTVKAPFDGFVVEEHIQVGQWIKRGGTVVTLAQMDPVLVVVPVPDRYVHSLKAGRSVSLEFDYLPRNPLRKGRVRSVIPQGDEKARTFPVEIEVRNRDLSLLAGMSCKVKLPVGSPKEALVVSKDAVVTRRRGSHLFVVRDEKAVLVPVRRGEATGDRVAVYGELSAGEWVVVEGNERLRPGQPVRPMERRGGGGGGPVGR
ncbi:MAG: efflux RND transporter periplasmic adaptor subunit [Deltaproteobacteria bacterium]|nr:efflux RND transporter periplasmic adaptor subunit [Deltaproteobacteria bacterium]